MKIAFFICDCGNGHSIRFMAILEKLLEFKKIIKIYIICGNNYNFIKNNIDKLFIEDIEFEYLRQESVFSWFPDKDGCPSNQKIKSYYDISFLNRIEKLIEKQTIYLNEVDIIINDGMPYANIIGNNLNIKSYSVFHFQWSWFLNKCYFLNVPDYVLERISFYEKNSTLNFCSEFTPSEIRSKLKNHILINPILRNDIRTLKNYYKKNKDLFNVSIVDSGANHSSKKILSILNNPYLSEMINIKKIIFNVFSGNNYENIIYKNQVKFYKNLSRKEYLLKLNNSDLIISRPGFNLLLELIYLEKPCLFFCENGNPEMVDTIYQLAKKGINNILPDDYKEQYIKIKQILMSNKNTYNLSKLSMNFDGASIVAQNIINNS